MKNKSGGVPHEDAFALFASKVEQTEMYLVHDALFYCEPCNVADICLVQVDFIYDSGTVSGVIGQ
jgi:hypothetical protein